MRTEMLLLSYLEEGSGARLNPQYLACKTHSVNAGSMNSSMNALMR